jgi:hypothetical protein
VYDDTHMADASMEKHPGESDRRPKKRWFPYGLTRYHTPPLAIGMSVYHAIILVGSLVVTTFFVPPETMMAGCTEGGTGGTVQAANSQSCHLIHWSLIVFAFSFGAMGSTLVASRYVVLAVRHRKYDSQRILWQLMTPLHGGVLACVAIYVVLGGLLTLSRSAAPSDQYGYFVGGFAFIVGFSSELFVKRLIRATEALFGESANIDELSKESDYELNQPRDAGSDGSPQG